jgi:hypothetical protein
MLDHLKSETLAESGKPMFLLTIYDSRSTSELRRIFEILVCFPLRLDRFAGGSSFDLNDAISRKAKPQRNLRRN